MSLSELSGYIVVGDGASAENWTKDALAKRVDPQEIVNKGLIPGMEEVGRKFSAGEYYMPEMLVAARAMKRCMAHLKPLLATRQGAYVGTAIIGTVQGDLHDIGKNLVAMMLEGTGFQVYDLGVDVPPERFVQAVQEHKPQIVGMSALLTTTMPMMKNTIAALKEAELLPKVKVMVGGAPITQDYANQIGAHGYAADAATAAKKAKALLGAHK